MPTLYVLVVDRTWARLYKTGAQSGAVTLLYHQALFGARPLDGAADEELARSLCRLLRADRQSGKFHCILMLAAPGMLAALRRQYDGDWSNVTTGRIDDLPARYTDGDIAMYLKRLPGRRAANGDETAIVRG